MKGAVAIGLIIAVMGFRPIIYPMTKRLIPLLATCLLLTGCGTGPDNPSFPVSLTGAHMAVLSMMNDPKLLPRPLVIIGGYEDPGILQTISSQYFQAVAQNPKIVTVSLNGCGSFEECRSRILDAVNNACPSTDPNWTAEVDVVGISLGGLAARACAAPPQTTANFQRLKIVRLFTLSSPLAGARVAKLGFTSFQMEIRPDSELQKYLAAVDPDPKYEIYSYVHLDDEMVGPENASIPGRNPYWLPNIPLVPILPHEQMMIDERAYADIARRLRGETPFTLPNPAPLPKD